MTGKTQRIEALEMRRLLSAGSLDSAFGSGGVVYAPLAGKVQNNSEQIAFQNDGKMIVAAIVKPKASSSTELELLRLTANGHVDSAFGNSGDVMLPATTSNWTMFQLDSANQIYVQIGQKLIRFASDGKTRRTVADTPNLKGLDSESILNNGKIIARKNDTIERFKSDGSPDTSFGSGGKVAIVRTGPFHSTMEGISMTVQHDGGVLVWQYAEDPFSGDSTSGLIRVTSSGKIDRNYGDNGFVDAEAEVASVVNLSGGAIAVLTETLSPEGNFDGTNLSEFDATGHLISSFDNGGVRNLAFAGDGDVLTQAFALFGLPNGKFLTVLDHSDDPSYTEELARLDADGGFDNTFNSTGRVALSGDADNAIPAPNGDILAYGSASNTKHAGQVKLVRYAGSPPVDTSSIATLSSAGVLSIFGTAEADTIQLKSDIDDTTDCIVNGKEAVFPNDKIKSIIIHAGAGDDSISAIGAQIGVTIIGDDGNDTIFGSGFNDVIRGNAGNDSIDALDGNDSLWGDAGNDTLLGDDGEDHLYARDGQVDSLDGGEGRDFASIDQSSSVHDVVSEIEKFV